MIQNICNGWEMRFRDLAFIVLTTSLPTFPSGSANIYNLGSSLYGGEEDLFIYFDEEDSVPIESEQKQEKKPALEQIEPLAPIPQASPKTRPITTENKPEVQNRSLFFVDDEPLPKEEAPQAKQVSKPSSNTSSKDSLLMRPEEPEPAMEAASIEPEEEAPAGQCSLSKIGAISLRHIEGKGIGYGEGYTTLDGFFTFPSSSLNHDFVPFIDVRGHVFNDGKFAGNAGLGVRLIRSHMHTLAAYYDYRATAHAHYNQVSLSYENLGIKFDWRVNGYLPVGDKYSSLYQPKFAYFQGHSLIISEKKEFAMWGINTEIAKHFYKKHGFDCYGAIGPYYFGRSSTNAWGGQARLGAAYKYIQIDLNTSYDTAFNWIGQGQLSIVCPLGPKNKKSSKNWCKNTSLKARATERVERNEIIVVDHKHKKSVAIDPATGLPYTFWFVSNTSNSLGTYESPYPTLAQAQSASSPNDIIYVFPGDGTDTGMNQGIILQNNQRLLGSSTAHPFNTTRGSVTVPALTTGLPYITYNSGILGVVTLASNNEVSGLSIEGFGNNLGIVGGNGNVYIQDCMIVSDNNSGIVLSGSNYGNVVIANNTIVVTNFAAGCGIQFLGNPNVGNVSINNCSIVSPAFGIQFDMNTNIGNVSISNCSILGRNIGIDFFRNTNIGPASVSDCRVISLLTTGIGIHGGFNQSGSMSVSNCTLSVPAGLYGISFDNTPNSTTTTFFLSLQGNTITNPLPTLFNYNIVNPIANPPSAFLLEFKDPTISTNFQNVTLVP